MCLYVPLGPGVLILFVGMGRIFTSVSQSKMLLATVLPVERVPPQRRVVAAATAPFPKLCSSLAASEFLSLGSSSVEGIARVAMKVRRQIEHVHHFRLSAQIKL